MAITYDLVLEGVILRIVRYKDSKAIVSIITPDLGLIQASITRFRSKKSNLVGTVSILNYVKFEAGKSSSSDFYSVRNVELISTLAYSKNYTTYLYQSAAAELLSKVQNYPNEDLAQLFHLLVTYLSYIQKVTKNQVVIYWRFVIKYFSVLGIPLELSKCSECHTRLETGFIYASDNHGFVGPECREHHQVKSTNVSAEAQDILLKLPQIGNFIDDLEISESVIREINKLLLLHISTTLHKDIYLRSLD
jgi:DNA repair protein RecO